MRRSLKQILLGMLTALTLGAAGLSAAESVMLTPNEGKAVMGDLLSADKNKVVLRTGEGESAKELSFTWDQIKKLSNGLTRDKAMAAWAAEHPDQVCDECKGAGQTFCNKCAGKGLLPDAPKVPCTKCALTGLAPCANRYCTLGKVACDGPCLKPSEGNWVKGKENLLWRRYTFPGGWAEWSEKHYGEVIKIENGRPVNKGKCEKCKGTLKMACGLCAGKARMPCPACKGSKEMLPDCTACKQGMSVCAVCQGTGEKQSKAAKTTTPAAAPEGK